MGILNTKLNEKGADAMSQDSYPRVSETARPQLTADLKAKTGLSDEMLSDLVHAFYGRVRSDALLGPIFDARIKDWDSHLEQMAAFWSSVALMTGRYHGTPMQKHLPLPVNGTHFARWLELFEETAREICPPEGAQHVIDRAHRIAQSLQLGIAGFNGDPMPAGQA